MSIPSYNFHRNRQINLDLVQNFSTGAIIIIYPDPSHLLSDNIVHAKTWIFFWRYRCWYDYLASLVSFMFAHSTRRMLYLERGSRVLKLWLRHRRARLSLKIGSPQREKRTSLVSMIRVLYPQLLHHGRIVISYNRRNTSRISVPSDCVIQNASNVQKRHMQPVESLRARTLENYV